MKANALFLVALAVALGTSAAPNGALGAEASHGIDAHDAELVALGNRVYMRDCAACHGKNLEGQTPDWFRPYPDGTMPAPPHDAAGPSRLHADDILFEIVKYGRVRSAWPTMRSHMPAFAETLSDREIRAVLSFIKSRQSAEAPPQPTR